MVFSWLDIPLEDSSVHRNTDTNNQPTGLYQLIRIKDGVKNGEPRKNMNFCFSQ